MKIPLKIPLIFLFLSFLLAQVPQDDIVISSVSNDPVEGQGNRYSSMAGGTTFYLRGSGFDQMQSNNLAFIGSSPAKVIGKLNFLLKNIKKLYIL